MLVSFLFSIGIIFISIQTLNYDSVDFINTISDSELLKVRNTNSYTPAIDRNSNDRSIIPIQLQNSERSQADANISNLITAVGSVGGAIAGGLTTHYLAQRMEDKRMQVRAMEKRLEQEEQGAKEKEFHEHIKQIVQIELTEYRDFLSGMIGAGELPPNCPDKDIRFIGERERFLYIHKAESLPMSYLERSIQERTFGFTPEQATKIEKAYTSWRLLANNSAGIYMPQIPGFEDRYGFNLKEVGGALQDIEGALAAMQSTEST
jgi:hypothetical protein